MVDVYVSGHGEYDANEYTKVPRGLPVIFYADVDTIMLSTVGMAALNTGKIRSRQEYGEGEWIPNYSIFPLKDRELVEDLASLSSQFRGQLYHVGVDEPVNLQEVKFCTTPSECNKRTPEQGHHPDCKGLLNLFGEATRLHVLACRVPAHYRRPGKTGEVDAYITEDPTTGARVSTSPYGESGTAYLEALKDEVYRILDWAARDPQAAIAYVDSLPQSSLVTLHPFEDFRVWLDAMRSPLTAESTPATINALVKLIKTYRQEVGDEETSKFWRTLPEDTRRVLAEYGGKPITDFMADTGEAVTISGTTGAPPRDFADAWEQTIWRNAFWRWLTDNPHQQVNADLLLDLHRRLADFPTDRVLSRREDFPGLEDLDYWFTHRWTTPPQEIAVPKTELHTLLVAPGLNPDNAAVEGYLADFHRIHPGRLPLVMDFRELDVGEQALLAAWVYDQPGDAPVFEDLPTATHVELTEKITELREVTTGLLEDLYADYYATLARQDD